MEMWCLDDVGRDSWDWVGSPTWESMIQLPRVEMEAPRLLQRSLTQVGLLLLLLLLLVVVWGEEGGEGKGE